MTMTSTQHAKRMAKAVMNVHVTRAILEMEKAVSVRKLY